MNASLNIPPKRSHSLLSVTSNYTNNSRSTSLTNLTSRSSSPLTPTDEVTLGGGRGAANGNGNGNANGQSANHDQDQDQQPAKKKPETAHHPVKIKCNNNQTYSSTQKGKTPSNQHERFPIEIMINIAKQLNNQGNQKTLVSFALTSKLYMNVGLDVLYRDVTLSDYDRMDLLSCTKNQLDDKHTGKRAMIGVKNAKSNRERIRLLKICTFTTLKTHQQALGTLLNNCPNLTTLKLWPSIIDTHWHEGPRKSYPTLQKLHLHRSFSLPLFPHKNLFPALEELVITFYYPKLCPVEWTRTQFKRIRREFGYVRDLVLKLFQDGMDWNVVGCDRVELVVWENGNRRRYKVEVGLHCWDDQGLGWGNTEGIKFKPLQRITDEIINWFTITPSTSYIYLNHSFFPYQYPKVNMSSLLQRYNLTATPIELRDLVTYICTYSPNFTCLEYSVEAQDGCLTHPPPGSGSGYPQCGEDCLEENNRNKVQLVLWKGVMKVEADKAVAVAGPGHEKKEFYVYLNQRNDEWWNDRSCLKMIDGPVGFLKGDDMFWEGYSKNPNDSGFAGRSISY